MDIHATASLFPWECLDDVPGLGVIRQTMAAIPDARLLDALRAARGKGRDDYAIQSLWGTFLLRLILRHPTMAACLAELRRNEHLRLLVGIESQEGVPKAHNMSRFEEKLGQEPFRTLCREAFDAMIAKLGRAVPDLGVRLAGDATALEARRKPEHKEEDANKDAAGDSKKSAPAKVPDQGNHDAKAGDKNDHNTHDKASDKTSDKSVDTNDDKTREPIVAKDSQATAVKPLSLDVASRGQTSKSMAAQPASADAQAAPQAKPRPRKKPGAKDPDAGLPQPTGGRKEYFDDAGKVVKIVSWYGYKLHLVVDAVHEVVLGWSITDAGAHDSKPLPAVLKQAMGNLPPGRAQSLAFDKAGDTGDTHQALRDAGVKPVIENRAMWRDELERRLPGHAADSNIVHDEAGTLYCYDTVSQPPVRHRMAYQGHEPARHALKYRCPSVHENWPTPCPMAGICNKDRLYGLTVRVNQEVDVRRFPDIPRATKQFERLYKGRTSVERVNARLKLFWGVDDGNLVGAARFHANVAGVLLVHAAFATVLASAPRREGTLGKATLSPIAKALLKPPPQPAA